MDFLRIAYYLLLHSTRFLGIQIRSDTCLFQISYLYNDPRDGQRSARRELKKERGFLVLSGTWADLYRLLVFSFGFYLKHLCVFLCIALGTAFWVNYLSNVFGKFTLSVQFCCLLLALHFSDASESSFLFHCHHQSVSETLQCGNSSTVVPRLRIPLPVSEIHMSDTHSRIISPVLFPLPGQPPLQVPNTIHHHHHLLQAPTQTRKVSTKQATHRTDSQISGPWGVLDGVQPISACGGWRVYYCVRVTIPNPDARLPYHLE